MCAQVIREMGARSGRLIPHGMEEKLARACLPGSMAVRLGEYEAVARKKNKTTLFLSNLQQRPAFSKNITSYVPTLLCQSFLYNSALDRPMARGEYFLVMGMPADAAWRHLSPVAELLAQESETGMGIIKPGLSDRESRLLCGNGMHVPCVGSVLLWILATLSRAVQAAEDPTRRAIVRGPLESDV